MGKPNNSLDIEAIIRKAVNAGMVAGRNAAKDCYTQTEKRLYALPALRARVVEKTQELDDIRRDGTPVRSKSIVRFNRSGLRVSTEEMLEAVITDLEASIEIDRHEIETIEKALSHIKDDEYYRTVSWKYLERRSDKELAGTIPCDSTTIWRNRKRLVQILAIWLYGADAVGE